MDNNREKPIIHTIGSSNRQIDEFLDILKVYGIERLADVRRFPTSKFDHFKRQNLTDILDRNGIKYYYFGKELGGYRKNGYDAHTQTEDFQRGRDELEKISKKNFTVIMCAEKLPWKCHRKNIGDHLRMREWRVVHIIDREKVWEPKKIIQKNLTEESTL